MVQRSHCPNVVTSRKFVDVALQMLLAELVEHALVRPLEDGLEALDAVGMGHVPHVLARTVVDVLVHETVDHRGQ